METTKPDGGPAFPQTVFHDDPCGESYADTRGGMSLRDYFAGQALIGFIASGACGRIAQEGVTSGATAPFLATGCYELADAMLAEREK